MKTDTPVDKMRERLGVDELRRCIPPDKQELAEVSEVSCLGAILPGAQYVYVLAINDKAIVVGHGKRNRAKVIFDNERDITSGHIKAIIVRLYTLFAPAKAQSKRFLIKCDNVTTAKEVEREIHKRFGGNKLEVPDYILEKLFDGFLESSSIRMVLRMALCSSFDGLTDLKRWRREGILNDEIWQQITKKLKL